MVRGAGLTLYDAGPRPPTGASAQEVPPMPTDSAQQQPPPSANAPPSATAPPSGKALEAAAAQEQQPDALDQLAGAQQELSFAQKPMVQNVLPFVTSVAVHVGILVIGWILIDPLDQRKRLVEEQ